MYGERCDPVSAVVTDPKPKTEIRQKGGDRGAEMTREGGQGDAGQRHENWAGGKKAEETTGTKKTQPAENSVGGRGVRDQTELSGALGFGGERSGYKTIDK